MKFIQDEAPRSAGENMEADSLLLENLGADACLRFYEWKGHSATYGHFIKPEDHFDLEKAGALNLSLARRPTGGGIIFHIGDLAFSVLVPACHPSFSLNTLENYALINRAVAKAVSRFTEGRILPVLLEKKESAPERFCMAKPTIYDVIAEEKKIGGAAQRRTKKGFLHQGSILLAAPPDALIEGALKEGPAVLAAMKRRSMPILEPGENLQDAQKKLRGFLYEELSQVL